MPNSERNCSAAARIRSPRRAARIRCAPSLANARALAAPMPELAPVIRTMVFLSEVMNSLQGIVVHTA